MNTDVQKLQEALDAALAVIDKQNTAKSETPKMVKTEHKLANGTIVLGVEKLTKTQQSILNKAIAYGSTEKLTDKERDTLYKNEKLGYSRGQQRSFVWGVSNTAKINAYALIESQWKEAFDAAMAQIEPIKIVSKQSNVRLFVANANTRQARFLSKKFDANTVQPTTGGIEFNVSGDTFGGSTRQNAFAMHMCAALGAHGWAIALRF